MEDAMIDAKAGKAGEAQRLHEPQTDTPERKPTASREPALTPEEVETLLSDPGPQRQPAPEKLEKTLLDMDAFALQKVLREVSKTDAAALLTVCRPETLTRIESQLSKGARRMLADEMRHTYSREQALAARENICARISRLEHAGEIILEMSPGLAALREEIRSRAADEDTGNT